MKQKIWIYMLLGIFVIFVGIYSFRVYNSNKYEPNSLVNLEKVNGEPITTDAVVKKATVENEANITVKPTETNRK